MILSQSFYKLTQMIKHPLHKFLGLTVLYIVIIFGIFLLQFRSDSSISNTFGALRLQLTESQNSQQEKHLKNRFQISFRGLVVSADETNPIKMQKADGTETDGVLSGWNKNSDLSCTLVFNEDVSLEFIVSDDSQDASLLIQAFLPEQIESLSIPYKPAGGHLVTEQTERHTIISSKSLQFEAEAAEVGPDRLLLTRKNSMAKYSLFDPAKMFEFGSVHGIASATKESYEGTLKQFKGDLIRLFNPATAESLPEQTVVAYVAAMAEEGKYAEAIRQIPSAVKTSSRRSFLSAPYFNTLVSMNRSLVMFMENRRGMLDNAMAQNSLDIFTLSDLPELLCITDKETATKIVSMPATLPSFEPSPIQAAGIIHAYTKLDGLNKGLASHIMPVLGICLDTIALACTLEENTISLAKDDSPLSVMDAAVIGTTLIKYGHLTNNNDYSATGYLIINSYFNGNSSISENLRATAELYPVLVPDNTFYPHIEIVATAEDSGTGKPVWAWTSAKSIGYNRSSDNNLTLSIDFPQGDTQYIIINGIEPFRRIDIYDMAFRTDPRFETYNSSGYVYNGETKTFFLKSLHRSTVEKVKLYYDQPASQPARPSGESQEQEQEPEEPEEQPEEEPANEEQAETTPPEDAAPQVNVPSLSPTARPR